MAAISPANPESWSESALRSGEQVRVFSPWNVGLAFTSDFQLANTLGGSVLDGGVKRYVPCQFGVDYGLIGRDSAGTSLNARSRL